MRLLYRPENLWSVSSTVTQQRNQFVYECPHEEACVHTAWKGKNKSFIWKSGLWGVCVSRHTHTHTPLIWRERGESRGVSEETLFLVLHASLVSSAINRRWPEAITSSSPDHENDLSQWKININHSRPLSFYRKFDVSWKSRITDFFFLVDLTEKSNILLFHFLLI